MKGRLWIINIILLGCVALAASVFRQRWEENRVREMAMLRQMIRQAPAPTVAPLPGMSPASPASYIEVAQRLVFSPDRNPNVIVDPPPPPPPPEPMPPLPVAYGIVNFGEGPTAILSPRSGAQSKSFRAGEKIGDFKLTAMNNTEIVFEWKGKYVKRRLEELVDRAARTSPPPAPPQGQAQAQAPTENLPPAPAANQGMMSLGDGGASKSGPSAMDYGNGSRACQPGDNSPAGTVEGGMRKVLTATPFGQSCRWEPAR